MQQCGFISFVVGVQEQVLLGEEIQKKEIKSWRNALIFASICAIPLFLIAVVFSQLITGPIRSVMEAKLNSAVSFTVADLLSVILATPVQFVSGYR